MSEQITSGDVLVSLLYQGSGGLLLGFATGYFLKKMMKAAALAVGAVSLVLILMSYYGIISVNWDKLALLVERLVGEAHATAASVQSWIIASIPFAGSFLAGVAIGMKYG